MDAELRAAMRSLYKKASAVYGAASPRQLELRTFSRGGAGRFLGFGTAHGPNPWGAKGLEWEKAESPPHTHNFSEKIIVTEPAYNYDAIEDNDAFRKKWGAEPVTYEEDKV